jgi:hypothetical protein
MRRGLLLVTTTLLVGGCAYHRVVVAVPNPPDQTYHPVNSSALGWGAIEQTSTAKNCPTNLLSEVRVKTSFAQALATVVTFGLWQPATIEYRCSKLPTQVIEP